MTVILQGDDVLRYHPITGLPLTYDDFTRTEMADGRIVIQLGDMNNPLSGEQA
jgi:hypothetical protein